MSKAARKKRLITVIALVLVFLMAFGALSQILLLMFM